MVRGQPSRAAIADDGRVPGGSVGPIPDEASMFRMRHLRWPHLRGSHLSIIAGVVLVAALSLGVWNAGREADQGDYFQFWAVGRLAGTGVTDIYSTSARSTLGAQINTAADAGTSTRAARAAVQWRVLETTGTPFLYAVFGALSTPDYDLDSEAWEALGLLVFIAGSIGLGLAFGASGFGALVVTALFVGTSAALVADVGAGNVNEVQVGILAAFLLLRQRWPTPRGDVAAGALLGALVAFKPDLAPVPGFLLVLWLIDHRFGTLRRVLLGAIEGGLLGVVVGTIAWRNDQVWLDWLRSLQNQLATAPYTIAHSNDSLARLIFEQSGVDVTLILAIGLGATIVAAMLRSRLGSTSPRATRSELGPSVRMATGGRPTDPNPAFGREVLTVGAAIGLTLLVSPLAWLHYYLLLVPLQLYLLRPVDPDGRAEAIRPDLRQAVVSISVVLLAFVPLDAVLGASPTADAVEAMVAAALLFAMAVLCLAVEPGPDASIGGARTRSGDLGRAGTGSTPHAPSPAWP
jgi:hypothetical protein